MPHRSVSRHDGRNTVGKGRQSLLVRAVFAGLALAGAGIWAMSPRSCKDRERNRVPAMPDVWYAHRGLHDAGSGLSSQYRESDGEYIRLARRMARKAGYGAGRENDERPIAPENSLAAFAAACEAGYGIELDLQLTADDRVVVAHDPDLLRVAGCPQRVADLTYDQLRHIPLFPNPSVYGDAKAEPLSQAELEAEKIMPLPQQSQYQHVPLFSDVLKVVGGRVPIIVEYKFEGNSWGARQRLLMESGDKLLRDYDGAYVVESFNPLAMRWYRQNHPEVFRGQLAVSSPFPIDRNTDLQTNLHSLQRGIIPWIAGKLGFNWVSRPDFVAYDWHGGRSPQLRLVRALGAVPVAWTPRSAEELEHCVRDFGYFIFESFIPSES
ncbi:MULTISPECIES: glycerophosphodiester phosphodiesterase family protein [unclassified Bifidobacterium]|uniref:glycerophosphodiester phosphodiesterase family protein n=1 Tax=unclassified Bifidobacterium TaxID=2608897 RepID=UPI0023F81515|nr:MULTISPECIES: glycerophosphodiester phosphodiesterase family protein [unclassified Bifidobacterium]WEV65247.1 glycerophosphodiester phosphodiesterase family protein [Bifidobacterium sp. ESL0764]WEV75950.1 glycerophosphodiester phosphodiesterase family protein [Bifidobacterium sp. ESL0800]